MSKAGQNKHHMPKTVHVAQKHLKKPEIQRAANTSRKLRPVRSAERREIIQRLRTGQMIRKIASEMGISQASAQQVFTSSGITYITACIQRFHSQTQDGKQAAVLEMDGMFFGLNPECYGKFASLIDKAYVECTPLFVIAQMVDDSFHVLHLKEGV